MSTRADTESGIDWIGAVPGHWQIRPVKGFGSVTLGKMLQSESKSENDIESPYLRAANIQPDGALALEDVKSMWFTPSETVDLDIRAGDVVVVEGGIGGFGRAAFVSEDLVGVGFQNSINRIRPHDGNDGRYLTYLLLTARKFGFIAAYCNIVSMPHLTAEKLEAMEIPTPPAGEQRGFADYLDTETARIDALIANQERLIATLLERRRVSRTTLVTSGTGGVTGVIETDLFWASTIPEQWTVVPLTTVATLESGHTPSREREELWRDCHIPWISLNDVGALSVNEYIADTNNLISDAGIAASSARLLPAGTVVLSRDATIGRSSIMAVPMATSQHFADWICGPDLDPRYLWLLFTSAMQPYFDSLTNGSTLRTIGMGALKSFKIPLPPLEEQRRIVTRAHEQTAKIDALIAKTEQFIELVKERHDALISAVVTGQVDVRTAAPKGAR